MYVIIGGAYSGKRKHVVNTYEYSIWKSAYEGVKVEEIFTNTADEIVVLEGFEIWISHLIKSGKSDEEILYFFGEGFKKSPNKSLILIMLEVGKGIVPVNKEDRRLRDVMGWIQQEAVSNAEVVTSVWHGLTRVMKNSHHS